jgi:hypothetical protein
LEQLLEYKKNDFSERKIVLDDFKLSEPALVLKVFKTKKKLNSKNKDPFFITKIETKNYGSYTFINLKTIPKMGDVIQFLVTNFSWNNASKLEILGSLSEEELKNWKEEIKKSKRDLKEKRKKAVKEVEINKIYYSTSFKDFDYIYKPIKKGITRVFVNIYSRERYVANMSLPLLKQKWVYPGILSEKSMIQRCLEKNAQM